jgi:hypothetical protein
MFDEELTGPWAKLKSYAGRFALVLHLLDLVTRPDYQPGADEGLIGAVTVERMVALVNYFKSHARLVYGRLNASPYDVPVKRLETFLNNQENEEERLSVIQNKVRLVPPGRKQTIEDVLRVCQHAQSLGLGEFVTLMSKSERKMRGFHLFDSWEVKENNDPEQTDRELLPEIGELASLHRKV